MAGPAPASDGPAPVLRLVEGLHSLERAYSRGHHGRWSARRRAQLVDECLVRLFRSSGVPNGVALAAVGGYGRGELAPASDIDLLLLHELRDGRVVRELAERLLYPLWDAGFDVGHGVRTVKESMALAAERFDVATAMLDARLLDGDAALFHSLRERLWEWSRKPRTAWVDRLRAAADVRRARFGSASQRLEPDVKEGSGGLRDVHTLGWLAPAVAGDGGIRGLESAGFLRAAEREALEAAEEYLVRVRSALHLEAGKKVDVLRQDLQPQLASDLGFSDEPGLSAPDGLMRAVFEHARDVEHIGAQVFDRVTRGAASATAVPGVSGTPETVIAAFAQAASRGDSVPPADLDMVDAARLSEVVEWTPSVRDAFLEILRAGEPGVGALEALDRAELLERFLPAWGAVRCRPQRDPYHRFPVDVHLLEALAEVSRLLRGQAPADDPVASHAAAAVGDTVDGLLLGALFHDIGKTGHGGHVAAGSVIAGEALEAMGLPEETRDMAQFLVANHLLLVDTATRRDLEDEDLVLGVAAQIETEERLAALYLLTVADASATGPHAWTPWRATLVRELVAKIQHAFERGEMGHEAAVRMGERAEALRAALRGQPLGEIERFLVRIPRNYLLGVAPERAARHFPLVSAPIGAVEVRALHEPGPRPGTYGLAVVARDRPGLLSRIAGALALSGLSILSAQVFTTEDDVAIDLFEVEGAFHGDVDEDRWRKFRSTLRKSVEGRLSLEYRVAEKRGYYPAPRAGIPTKVTVDNRASDFFTIIEIATADRIGLLFDVTRTLTDLQLDVHIAKVATYGDRVIDAFYVRDVVGRKIEDPDHQREIVTALKARLSE
ncbi:MAG: bifunctional uridylyltransferase/uridylyl-removing protein GlnD [Actinomycetota bacterium]